jgi:hypothetical protein
MNPLTLIPGWAKLALAAALMSALTGGYLYWTHHQRDIGRAEVQLKWDASASLQRAAALAESESNARESLRRIDKQQENQLAQDRKLSQARADAGRNDAAAGQLRAQLADTARRWRDATRNPTTGGECQAAGDAIVLSAELFSRIDKRAGELAEYADAARIAGEKCTRDYDALMPNSRGAE